MASRIPSFKCIEAFALAAKSLSFTEAASVLHITVPAVSRRIKALEGDLGVALFRRKHYSLSLTRIGQSYAEHIFPVIDAIRRASDAVRIEPRNAIRINLPPCFAANWLLPRLHSFFSKHHRIEIELDTGLADLDRNDIDLAIRLGSEPCPGLRADPLLDVNIYPVFSPHFLPQGRSLDSVAALLKYPLLAPKHQNLWPRWLALARVVDPQFTRSLDNTQLVYEAAANRLGIALALDASVQPYLDAIRLVRVLDDGFVLREKLRVLYRPRVRERVAIRQFLTWLAGQAENWKVEQSEHVLSVSTAQYLNSPRSSMSWALGQSRVTGRNPGREEPFVVTQVPPPDDPSIRSDSGDAIKSLDATEEAVAARVKNR